MAALMGTPMYLLKMTQLFYLYKSGSDFQWKERKEESYKGSKAVAVIAVIAVIAAVFLINVHFDQLFPPDTGVKVIAHRGGGSEGAENTASGQTLNIQGGYLDIGILDTMKDLLVNLIGAVVFSIIGYTSLKTSKSSKVAESLMIRPNERGDDIAAATEEITETAEEAE